MNITLTGDANSILGRIRNLSERGIGRASGVALDAENALTVSHIQYSRMNFPFPGSTTLEGLRSISGRLKSSVRQTAARIEGNAVVSGIGSNVEYMGVHEFGFEGDVMVSPHTRRVESRNVVRIGPRGGKKTIAEGIAQVRSFTRHMRLPERAPIRRGIEDRAANYTQRISQEIVHAWNTGGGA
jgi:hypothetical protein